MKKFAITSMVALAGVLVSALAQQNNATPVSTLKAAVVKFNEGAQTHLVGKTQLPLTQEEVVAAIRGWIPESTPGVTEEIYEKFQAIAESGELPANAQLSSKSVWTGYRGYHFKVWWIDLSIETGAGTAYTFRIRDQKISSARL